MDVVIKGILKNKYVALMVWSIIIIFYGLYSFIYFAFSGNIYGSNFGLLIRLCFLLSLIVVWLGIFGVTLFLDKKTKNNDGENNGN